MTALVRLAGRLRAFVQDVRDLLPAPDRRSAEERRRARVLGRSVAEYRRGRGRAAR